MGHDRRTKTYDKGLIMKKQKCPYCSRIIENNIPRKQPCPYCNIEIFVRSGELVTEDEAITLDWMDNLINWGISRKDFEKARKKLSKRFGKRASAQDTVWNILNNLLAVYALDNDKLRRIHQFMADLLADEDKDPTSQLIEAAKARNLSSFEFRKSIFESKKGMAKLGFEDYDLNSINEEINELEFSEFEEDDLKNTKLLFLGDSQLAYIRRLAKQEKFKEAEELLYKADPSPAVVDEIRKICSRKAWIAKKKNDWRMVIKYLEEYSKYADEWKDYCIKSVNQAPREHTEKDKKLLRKARELVLGMDNE